MKWILLFISLLLVGCGHTQEKQVVDNFVLVPIDCEDFGRIESVKSLPVVYVKATDDNGNIVLGLRGDMYSNLSIIMRDSLRFIGEQKKAIDYYKNCIERHNSIELNEEGEPL